MKVLAYLLSLSLIFTSLLFVGCESDPADDIEYPSIEEEDEPIILTEEFTEITFDAVKGSDAEAAVERVVKFTAAEPWEISIGETKAADSWVTVSPMSGDAGDAEITISLEPNADEEDRQATILIVSGETTNKISVVQEGYEELIVMTNREVLIDLYNSTDGDNWVDNSNWCSNKPISD